jgi:hypothetical protein
VINTRVNAMAFDRPRRRSIRRQTEMKALVYAGAASVPCVVQNLSDGGAGLVLTGGLQADRFSLFTGAASPMMECAVTWRDADRVGVRFL